MGAAGFGVEPGVCKGAGALQEKASKRLSFPHLMVGRNRTLYKKETEATAMDAAVPEGSEVPQLYTAPQPSPLQSKFFLLLN